MADPVLATPRNPQRKNLLEYARRIGQLVGIKDFTPWQEYAIALATEYEVGHPTEKWEYSSGVWVTGIVPYYEQVVITVPRQTGKTEIVEFILWLLRFFGYMVDDPPLMIYIAQTQSDAKRVISTKIWPRLQLAAPREMGFYYSPAAEDPHIRMSGRSNVDFRLGKLSILANKDGSGLGMTSTYANMDEARQFGDSSRENDILPQMNTAIGRQTVVCSTMGNEKSIYFNSKVDAGRELATEQLRGNLLHVRRAYMEWGVGDVTSDDYDVEDRTIWLNAHPLIGYHNWTLDRMADEYDRYKSERNVDGFRNNYLNQRMAASDVPGIAKDLLDAVEVDSISNDELGSPSVLALNSATDSEYVGAVVAGNDNLRVILTGDTSPPARVSKYNVVEWLDGYLPNNRHIRRIVVLADSEMSGALRDFYRQGCPIEQVQFAHFKQMCYSLVSAVNSDEIRIEQNKYFRMAVNSAERQESIQAKNWVWRRKEAVNAPIDELMAATLAWGCWEQIKNKPKLRVL